MKTQISGGVFGVLAFFALAGTAMAVEVYVPLGDGNRILVIDSRTDTVVRTIADVPNVHGLAKTPDGRFLIAASLDENTPGGRGMEKPAGVSANDHDVHHAMPSQQVREDDAQVSTISIIRKSDGKVIRYIDVPGAVHHVSVSPDGRTAALTHPGKGSVTLIDLEDFKVIRTIATGDVPNYAAFDPTGKRLYVSNGGGETISDIDTASWTVSRNLRVGAGPEHLVLSPDGQTLYVNNVIDGTVSALSLTSGKVARTFTVGNSPHGIDLSEDGKTLFVSGKGDNRLYAIDVGSDAKTSVRLDPSPYHLAVVRGEGKLYVSSAADPKIWVIDQKTLRVIGDIPIGGKGHQMAIVPGS